MRNFKFIFILFILISFLYPGYSFARSFKIFLSKKNDGYPKKFQKKLEHPYDISEEVLKKSMKNLYYMEKRMGRGWKKEKKVFTDSFVDASAARIKRALNKAKSSQKIVIKSINSNEETICDIFIKEEVLNFRFDKINGSSKRKNMWIMLPKLAQRYYNPPKSLIPGNLEAAYKDRTWIRIPLIEFAETYQMEVTPDSENEAIGASNPCSKGLNKLEKMKALKEAFDNKLLLQQEYRKKAIKLLRSPVGVKMSLKNELFYFKLMKSEGFISEDYYDQKKKVLLENL